MVFGGAGWRTRRAAALLPVVAVLSLAGCMLTGCTLTDGSDQDTRVRSAAQARVGGVEELRAGGHRFAVRCAGDEQDPPVLLVSDLATPMERDWDSVQGRIGASARVCAYDRRGVGRSGPAPRSQTFEDMATDLRAVVGGLGLKPPLLLVAHGIGGMVAVTAMQQAPDLAGGLLLLDAAGPGYPQAALDALAGSRRAGPERDTWARLLQPESNREHLDGRQAFAQAQAFRSLGPVPMVALTHSIAEHAPGTPGRRQADLESAWEAGQNGWLALAGAGRLERVDLAGHDIAADRPEVVVDRVTELLPAGD
ncbi:MAG TPA: alpha/beta fold hydrolase [Actinomycetes bacterium]|nr:alpha/beta fold hydrolase [Actinomycetes bacterium]